MKPEKSAKYLHSLFAYFKSMKHLCIPKTCNKCMNLRTLSNCEDLQFYILTIYSAKSNIDVIFTRFYRCTVKSVSIHVFNINIYITFLNYFYPACSSPGPENCLG